MFPHFAIYSMPAASKLMWIVSCRYPPSISRGCCACSISRLEKKRHQPSSQSTCDFVPISVVHMIDALIISPGNRSAFVCEGWKRMDMCTLAWTPFDFFRNGSTMLRKGKCGSLTGFVCMYQMLWRYSLSDFYFIRVIFRGFLVEKNVEKKTHVGMNEGLNICNRSISSKFATVVRLKYT